MAPESAFLTSHRRSEGHWDRTKATWTSAVRLGILDSEFGSFLRMQPLLRCACGTYYGTSTLAVELSLSTRMIACPGRFHVEARSGYHLPLPTRVRSIDSLDPMTPIHGTIGSALRQGCYHRLGKVYPVLYASTTLRHRAGVTAGL